MRDYTKKPRSPYAKYGKKPYRYSEIYRAWRQAAVVNKDLDRALELAIEHATAFGYPPPVATDPSDWV